MFVFTAAVVGAGTMGAQIAYAIADADIPVVLKDVGAEPVDRGVRRARSLWDARVKAGKLTAAEPFGSADGREGIAAFLAKRVPHWTGA